MNKEKTEKIITPSERSKEYQIVMEFIEEYYKTHPVTAKEKLEDIFYSIKNFGGNTAEVLKYIGKDIKCTVESHNDTLNYALIPIGAMGLSLAASIYLGLIYNKEVDKSLLPTQNIGIREFEPGEHTVSKKESDSSVWISHIPGYKVKQVSNGVIDYENDQKVVCISNVVDVDNNCVYEMFGIPTESKTNKKTLVLK